MNARGLDGRTYRLKLERCRRKRRHASGPHVRARLLLASLYPTEERLEEVFLPGCGRLYLDFLLPARRLAVEVQGEQHYQYSLHFHKDRLGYKEAQARDNRKRQWCELNTIRLCEWPSYESDDLWRERLLGGG